jgi:endo-1,4-beta-xylanase
MSSYLKLDIKFRGPKRPGCVAIGFLLSFFCVVCADAGSTSLRALANGTGVHIGASVMGRLDFRNNDPKFLQTLAREYSLLTVGNDLKWAAVRPSRDVFNFQNADDIVSFAEQHGMKVRGHTLVWWNSLPIWLTGGTWTRNELIGILRDHIKTVVGRYKGRILAWDVVNEAFTANGFLMNSIWLNGIGPDYIEMAFQWAHEADPNCLLFLNEDGSEGLGVGSDRIYNFVADLLARGIPINGVGLQMHLDSNYVATGGGLTLTPADVQANMARLGALGLQVHITEMDVRIPVPASEAVLIAQADVYRQMLQTCLSVPACTALVTWGLTDKVSWIPGFFPGLGAALPFDENYKPKPAYAALQQTLADANPNVPVGIFAPYLPDGEVGVAYFRDLQVGGGDPPYVTSIAKGAPPPGLGLGSPVVTGTPTVAGTERFTVQVTDNFGDTVTRNYKIKILKQIGITTTSLKAGTAGKKYSNILKATGGKKPYIWSIVSGVLLGLTLNPATGKISGTPPLPGSSVLTVQVTDPLSL